MIGNPPYKEKAKGRGGWIEEGDYAARQGRRRSTPGCRRADWGVGAHAKHLRNLYVYFWRWATWKVFDHDPKTQHRHRLLHHRRRASSTAPASRRCATTSAARPTASGSSTARPKGHQPDVPTRIFQGVQQPVCIVLVARSKAKAGRARRPRCKYTVLAGRQPRREVRGPGQARRSRIEGWARLPDRLAGAVPARGHRRLGDLPGPRRPVRLQRLRRHARPHLDHRARMPNRCGGAGRSSSTRQAGAEGRAVPSASSRRQARRRARRSSRVERACPGYDPTIQRRSPMRRAIAFRRFRYGFRSFDRQWIIPDNRVINQPNPELWRAHSEKQVYLTALHRHVADVGSGAHLHRPDSGSSPLQRLVRRPRLPALARSRGDRAEPAAEAARLPGEEVQDAGDGRGFAGVPRRRGGPPGVHGPLSGRPRRSPACASR